MNASSAPNEARATTIELERVRLSSGREIVFRRIDYGDGLAFEIASLKPDGRETTVRVAPKAFGALRRALDAVDADAWRHVREPRGAGQ
jgi:hypothetical protein